MPDPPIHGRRRPIHLGQPENLWVESVSFEIVEADEASANKGERFSSDEEVRAQALRRSPSFRFFWDNPLSIERRPEVTTIALGTSDADELRMHRGAYGQYDEVLLEQFREHGDRIEDGVPTAEIERRFQVFRGRKAVLPPQLVALRED